MGTTNSNVDDEDTICAVSTPPGEGGIGIVRLSGRDGIRIVDSIFRSPRNVRLGSVRSRRLVYGHIVKDGRKVDEVLVSVMHAPHTYTREDIVEINCHSGIAALRTVLETVLERGARMAQPGEFTKRAFLNGRIDLTQAEAVLDIIQARTEEALTAAVVRADGGLCEEVLRVRDRLVGVLAHLEAWIDFPEDDIAPFVTSEAKAAVEESLSRIGALIEESWRGMLYREGVAVAITGKPNVGKSSVFNALLRRSRAIVARHPGTTRDMLEETLNIDGVPVRLSDSAGIRSSDDEVEQMSLRIAEQSVAEAQIVLFVLDQNEPLTAEDDMVCARIKSLGKETVVVVNKMDLPGRLEPGSVERLSQGLNCSRIVRTSATERTGIDELEKAVSDAVFKGRAPAPTQALVARVYQREKLRAAQKSLGTFLEAARDAMPAECLAIDLRDAIQALGEIVGEVTTEDILDRIFSEFCVGK
ncbi:MAG: tRNA uridine-5-carboxymethylaminomethyl(34) synthesis GTPase MnmE [Candidatus Hydrogenedentes bacterium]|nr:tRNA uridine-5-carboxymethylaminomethyl(34) synthesis GTPase MnmE [Candidatus Hydrogenedentota bacterium]